MQKIVQDAYDEGVEDGIGWHCYPESGPQPQWIDSVARVELLKTMRTAAPTAQDDNGVRIEARTADLQLALDYALSVLEQLEPGDSRAMSDEFVSMASVACDCANDEAREILRAALAARGSPDVPRHE